MFDVISNRSISTEYSSDMGVVSSYSSHNVTCTNVVLCTDVRMLSLASLLRL